MVRGQVPRKQGLKQLCVFQPNACKFGPRASSKKTRIETCSSSLAFRLRLPSEGKFQENKDWNYSPAAISDAYSKSEGKFQENKDWNTYKGQDRTTTTGGPRASSKKTRIETWIAKFNVRCGGVVKSEGKFQENKDWNFEKILVNGVKCRSEGKFQENKDWNSRRSK